MKNIFFVLAALAAAVVDASGTASTVECASLKGSCSSACPKGVSMLTMGRCANGAHVCCSGTPLAKVEEIQAGDARCHRAGGVCSNSCASGNGGKWLTGICSHGECCLGGTAPIPGKSYATYFLPSQSFDNDNPGALLYIPSSFRREGELNIVLFVFGESSCLESAVKPEGAAGACFADNAPSPAFDLIDQMEAAAAQSILIVFETPSESATNLGSIVRPGGLRAFLTDILSASAEQLGPNASEPDLAGVSSIQLVATMGGGFAAALIAEQQKDVYQLEEILLLGVDEGYGRFYPLYSFIQNHARHFGPSPAQFRFGVVYDKDDQEDVSLLLNQIGSWWKDSLHPNSLILVDNTTQPLPADSFVIPILFKHAGIPAAEIAANYLHPFVSATFGTDKAIEEARKHVKTN